MSPFPHHLSATAHVFLQMPVHELRAALAAFDDEAQRHGQADGPVTVLMPGPIDAAWRAFMAEAIDARLRLNGHVRRSSGRIEPQALLDIIASNPAALVNGTPEWLLFRLAQDAAPGSLSVREQCVALAELGQRHSGSFGLELRREVEGVVGRWGVDDSVIQCDLGCVLDAIELGDQTWYDADWLMVQDEDGRWISAAQAAQRAEALARWEDS